MRPDIVLLMAGMSSGFVTNQIERRQMGGGDLFSGIASIVQNSIKLGTGLLGAFSKANQKSEDKKPDAPTPPPTYMPEEPMSYDKPPSKVDELSNEQLKAVLMKIVEELKKVKENPKPEKDEKTMKMEDLAKEIIAKLKKDAEAPMETKKEEPKAENPPGMEDILKKVMDMAKPKDAPEKPAAKPEPMEMKPPGDGFGMFDFKPEEAPKPSGDVMSAPQDLFGMGSPSEAPSAPSSPFGDFMKPGGDAGGMSPMGDMGGMGGMSPMGGIPDMGSMGGMGGMPDMGSMGGMGGMPDMGSMGGMGGMPDMGGMGGGMGGMPF